MGDVFDFLGQQENDAVDIVTGGDFSPTGFIGPVMAAVVWKFWSATDLTGMGEPEGLFKRGKENSWFYFHADRDAAKKAAALAGAFPPSQCWRFEMPTASILNIKAESLENWGDVVSSDCRISTKGKHFHECHLFSLPFAVQAFALRAGYISKRIISADECFGIGTCQKCQKQATLCPPGYYCQTCGKQVERDYLSVADTIFTDDLQARVIGSDTKSYKESTMWLARAALWEALGEKKAEVFNPIGTGSKFDTTSEKLSNCLRTLTVRWMRPQWARLMNVPDPRTDAVYGDGKRLSIPVLWEIFASEDAARAAAALEKQDNATAQTQSGPALPASWAQYPKEWKDEVRNRKTASEGKLPAMSSLMTMAGELACTADELKTWWELV